MLLNNFYKLSLSFIALLFSANQINAFPFRQGEKVELLKNENLYFNSTVFRRGTKGEHFVVADHRPAEKRLYVLSKDPNNRLIALNFPDSSAGSVVPELAAYAEKAFEALESGKLKEAKTLLSGLLKNPTMQPICKRVLDSIQALETQYAEFQLFNQKK
jgi:hypothetical protein